MFDEKLYDFTYNLYLIEFLFHLWNDEQNKIKTGDLFEQDVFDRIMLVRKYRSTKEGKPPSKYKRKELKRQKFRVNDEEGYGREERMSWKREKEKQR